MKNITEKIESIARKKERPLVMCGAGRGMVLVDVNGTIWPCHRWNKDAHQSWRIGSIYENFSEEARKKLDVRSQIVSLVPNCHDCESQWLCAGGCPAENLEASGNVFAPIENTCRIFRILTRIAQEVHDNLFQEKNTEFMKIFYPNILDDSTTKGGDK